MTICELITSELKEKKMSIKKLAEKTGIPAPSLYSAFKRNTKLSLDMLFPILDCLVLYPSGLKVFYDTNYSDDEIKTISNYICDKQDQYENEMQEELYNSYLNLIKSHLRNLNDQGIHEAIKRVGELTQLNEYSMFDWDIKE